MSYWKHQRPVRRERLVDTGAVALAAMQLLDSGGLRTLTLRAVATDLGVAPASLYSRVNSVEDLFDLALDAALGSDPDFTRAADEADLHQLLMTYYRHLVRHPWASQVIAMRPPRGPHHLRLSERLCRLLVDAGTDDPLAAAYALSNFVIGSAVTAPVAEHEPTEPVDAVIAPTYARLHDERTDSDAERTVASGIAALTSAFTSRQCTRSRRSS